MTGPGVTTSRRTLVLLGLSVLMTVVAGIDTGIEGRWDGLAVLALAVLAQLALVVGLRRGRRPVALRGDLAGWLGDRSAATGEPLEHIVDRCVAAYRAGLTAEPGRSDGGRR